MKKPCSNAVVLALMLLTGASSSGLAASSPMVEHRLFTPGDEVLNASGAAAAQAVNNQKVEKELSLTGIVITPQEKKAIIRDNIKSPEGSKNRFYHEGDQIKDMKIKEIQHTYVILASQDSTLKLSLYRGDKARPVAVPIPQETPAQKSPQPGTAAQNQTTPQPANAQPTAQSPPLPAPAPNAGKGNQPAPSSPSPGPASEAQPTNPFTEALQKAAAARSAQGTAQGTGGFANPFAMPSGN